MFKKTQCVNRQIKFYNSGFRHRFIFNLELKCSEMFLLLIMAMDFRPEVVKRSVTDSFEIRL